MSPSYPGPGGVRRWPDGHELVWPQPAAGGHRPGQQGGHHDHPRLRQVEGGRQERQDDLIRGKGDARQTTHQKVSWSSKGKFNFQSSQGLYSICILLRLCLTSLSARICTLATWRSNIRMKWLFPQTAQSYRFALFMQTEPKINILRLDWNGLWIPGWLFRLPWWGPTRICGNLHSNIKLIFPSRVQIQEDDDDLEEIYESHPMMLMIKYKRTDLLGHPLCRALVRYKWTTVMICNNDFYIY